VLCTKVLKHGGNTTNLHNHFKNVHKLHIARESPSKNTSLDQQKSSIKDAANKENELNEATCSTSSFDLMLQRQEESLNNADMDIDDPVVIEQSISDPESQNRPATRLHSFQGRKLVNKQKNIKSLILYTD